MIDRLGKLRFGSGPKVEPELRVAAMPRVGVVDGALGEASAASLFPGVEFVRLSDGWTIRDAAGLGIIVTAVDGGLTQRVEETVQRLKTLPPATALIVVLSQPDVATTRRLVREGAADVLLAPVSEAALALALERLLERDRAFAVPPLDANEVVAVLKAGGGVGATALTTQLGAMLAARGKSTICVADLDLQFGCAALYYDLPDALTVADCLRAGPGLQDTPFDSALARHRSGVRLLAAPAEMTPLELLGPTEIDPLIAGLRRDFGLTLIDLPSVWTAWTNRVLQLADRIVLVTNLSVAHIHLVRCQLAAIEAQGLGDRPLTLVCNALAPDQTASLSLKAGERALGRPFDVVIPEDRKVMNDALNQGLEIASIKRGTKLEKAIALLADRIVETQAVVAARRSS